MLFHSPLYPAVSGVMKRNLQAFLEASKHHEVSLLAFGTKADEASFRKRYGGLCKRIVFYQRPDPRWLRLTKSAICLLTLRSEARYLREASLQNEIDAIAATERFDLVHMSTPFFAFCRLPAGVPLIADAHNVEHDMLQRTYREATTIGRKLYYWIVYLGLKRDELRVCRKISVIMATSKRDGELFQKLLPGHRVVVVPNGVDASEFAPQVMDVEPHSMVFTGIMQYYPNNHGISYFLEHIFPLINNQMPDAKVYVVGAHASKRVKSFASDRVVITGFVDDVRPYIARAEVVIIPLLIGGGTRLKALEAMAMKKPIVSTSIGCEGIDLVPGETVLIGDTPQAFADAVIRLFADAGLRTRVVEQAYEIMCSTYSWEAISKQYQDAFALAACPKA